MKVAGADLRLCCLRPYGQNGLHTTASPVSRATRNGRRGVEPQRISLRIHLHTSLYPPRGTLFLTPRLRPVRLVLVSLALGFLWRDRIISEVIAQCQAPTAKIVVDNAADLCYSGGMKTKEAIRLAGSTKQLADMLGISSPAVSQWGENVPEARLWQLRVLCPVWFMPHVKKFPTSPAT